MVRNIVGAAIAASLVLLLGVAKAEADFTRLYTQARTYEQQKRFDEAAATLRELVAVEKKAGDEFHMEIANRDLARVLLLAMTLAPSTHSKTPTAATA